MPEIIQALLETCLGELKNYCSKQGNLRVIALAIHLILISFLKEKKLILMFNLEPLCILKQNLWELAGHKIVMFIMDFAKTTANGGPISIH